MHSMVLPETLRQRAASPPRAAELTPTVFVVDGDMSVRDTLGALLQGAGWEVRTFGSAETFLNCPPAVGPSCLVLDVGLPDQSGLEVQAQVARERATMPVIFVTACADVPLSVRAMKAGALEFLMKPVQGEVLLEAIEAAVERSRATVGQQTDLQALRSRYATLSRRERQVMAAVATGLLNKQVAFELSITEFTVKVHRGRVMNKMKARSLADLVKMSERLQAS